MQDENLKVDVGEADEQETEIDLEAEPKQEEPKEEIVVEEVQAKEEPEPEPYVETYKDKRLKEYGSVEEQIEFITEKGLDAWKTNVDEIKKKYPKE